MKQKEIIYYKDELNEEFSTAKIVPRKIDENYKYIHKSVIWNAIAFLLQNVLSVPIKFLYAKIKFKIKYVGKEKLKPYKKQGYFKTNSINYSNFHGRTRKIKINEIMM